MAKDISKRLKEVIKDSGLTHAELEAKTGVPRSAIQRYAAGDTEKIPVDRLQKIADVCGSSISYILGIDEETKALHVNDLLPIVLDFPVLSKTNIINITHTIDDSIKFYKNIRDILTHTIQENTSLIEYIKEKHAEINKQIETRQDNNEPYNDLAESAVNLQNLLNILDSEEETKKFNSQLDAAINTFKTTNDLLLEVKDASEMDKEKLYLLINGIKTFGDRDINELNEKEIHDLYSMHLNINNSKDDDDY